MRYGGCGVTVFKEALISKKKVKEGRIVQGKKRPKRRKAKGAEYLLT